MLIGLLIMYGIMGAFMWVQLNDDCYLDDLSVGANALVCFICGPITFGLWLLGFIYIIIKLGIIWIIERSEK